MKRNFKYFTAAIFILISVFITEKTYAHPDMTPIDADESLMTLNGTYDIERMIIKDNEGVILDSDDYNAIDTERGEAALVYDNKSKKFTVTFRMQLTGKVFKEKTELAPYSFIYKKVVFDADSADKLSKNGLTIFTRKDVKFEIKADEGRTIIIYMEKDRNKVKEISDEKYILMGTSTNYF